MWPLPTLWNCCHDRDHYVNHLVCHTGFRLPCFASLHHFVLTWRLLLFLALPCFSLSTLRSSGLFSWSWSLLSRTVPVFRNFDIRLRREARDVTTRCQWTEKAWGQQVVWTFFFLLSASSSPTEGPLSFRIEQLLAEDRTHWEHAFLTFWSDFGCLVILKFICLWCLFVRDQQGHFFRLWFLFW